jgi:OmpA-OmpF porin, OOP family
MRTSSRRSLGAALLAGAVFGSVLTGARGAAAQDLPSSSPPPEAPAADDPTAIGGESWPTWYRFEFGVYAGAHFFADEHHFRLFSDDSRFLSPKDAGAFGLRFGFQLNPHVSIEADGWWTPTRTRSLNDDKKTDLSVFGYRASLLVDFIGRGPFRPFVMVGAGGMNSIVKNENILPNDSDPVLHAGVGAKVFLTPRVGLRLDGIIMSPPAFASSIIEVGEETEVGGPDFQLLGTIFFNFGEVAPPQVIVKEKTVVLPPPPPPVDPDADGIAGDADKCPNVAEDRDGFEDDDGCPEPDNDKDGVPDPSDKCPLKPETANGIDDEDGCPEEDIDNDGFFGSRDQCPDAPETKNGFQDTDGCPDELPPAVKKFVGVIEGIKFKTGSANILPGSFTVLDRAIAVLKEYPDLKLEIQGHTDNRGKAEYNKNLSQKRADAVRTYFVTKGIAAERLTAVGYGLEKPIADNKTESGRATNRRTEFQLITQ